MRKKIDISLNLLLKPIDKNVAVRFLNHTSLRTILISEYPFFNTDSNKEIYKQFVGRALKKRRNIEHAIEIAIATHFYHDLIDREVRRLLCSNVSDTIKLTCLDYILLFKKQFGKARSVKLMRNAIAHTKQNNVIIQALLIYCAYAKDPKTMGVIISRLRYEDRAFVFYRTINTVVSFNELNYMKKPLLEKLKEIIKKSKVNTAQKEEIKKLIMTNLLSR